MIKRIVTVFLLVCYLFSFGSVYASAQSNYLDSSRSLDGDSAYLGQGRLVDNVQAAFMFETKSQSVLYAFNADASKHPAGLVKIMTAILVLENGNLQDQVTVTENAVNSIPYDAISCDLVAGEVISVEDLMYCMMVKAANDAAAVLAEYVSGSQTEFVEKMNARATELGCTGTFYVNVHGLHDDRQVTTARDLCKIINYALQFDFFRTVFGAVYYTVPQTNKSEPRPLVTNNYLMNADSVTTCLDPRVIGGRTGVTSDGCRNVASVSQDNNMEVICVVIGSASTVLESGKTDRYGGFPETTALLDYAFDSNTQCQILFENQIISQIPVMGGDNDLFVAAAKDISAIIPVSYSMQDIKLVFSEQVYSLQAPVAKGTVLGSVRIMDGDTCIAESEVYAANDVRTVHSKAGTYIDVAKKNRIWLVILIIAVLLAAALIVYRKHYLKKMNNRVVNQPWREDV